MIRFSMTTLLLVLVPIAFAQDAKDSTKEKGGKASVQKTTALDSLKSMGLEKAAVAESTNLILAGPLSESRLKTLADGAEKTFAFARTTLKLEPKDEPWTGKLTVIVCPEGRLYGQYFRSVVKRSVERTEWFNVNLRGDTPTVVVIEERGEKAKDAEMTATVGMMTAIALLNKKAGAGAMTGQLPEWLELGFGRLMVAKASGGSAWTEFRAKSKLAAVGTKTKASPILVETLWSGTKNKDAEFAAASFVEYMIYGQSVEKFVQFAVATKPLENGQAASLWTALEAAEWKADQIDFAWKSWAAKAK